MTLDVLLFVKHIAPHHATSPLRRLKQSAEHTHSGSLTGSVGTQESEYLTASYRQRDMVNRRKITKTLGQPFYLNHGIISTSTRITLKRRRTKHIGMTTQQILGFSYIHHMSVLHKRHAMTPADFVNIRCSHHNTNAFFRKALQQAPEFRPRHGIDSGCGFVEQEQTRTMNQGTAKRQFLLHSSRQLPGPTAPKRLQLYVKVVNQVFVFRKRHAKQRGKEIQVLLHRQIRIERKTPRHIAYMAPHIAPVTHHVMPLQAYRSLVGQEQRSQEPEQCRFSGSVGTNQPEYFPCLHGP